MEYKIYTLPYPFSGLEPHIDTETMDFHYSKHYRGYTDKLNKDVSDFEEESIESLMSRVSKLSQSIRNKGGGYYNHTLFFSILSPGGTIISSRFKSLIDAKFGGMEEFKSKFKESALSRFGSGWCWLIKKDDGELEICTTANQDNPLMDISLKKGQPVIGLDLWEHSYYLKYKNKRDEYIENFWSVINWESVENLYNYGKIL